MFELEKYDCFVDCNRAELHFPLKVTRGENMEIHLGIDIDPLRQVPASDTISVCIFMHKYSEHLISVAPGRKA